MNGLEMTKLGRCCHNTAYHVRDFLYNMRLIVFKSSGAINTSGW